MKLIRLATCLAALTFVTTAAIAQNAPPVRVRGEVAGLDGNNLMLRSRDGQAVTIKLANDWAVLEVSPVTMAAIKKDSFVGIAAQPAKGGELRALEVLVFPEAARGTGEGHYPWDLTPESNMTNAAVAANVASKGGNVLTLNYKGGTQKITVSKDTPIVTFAPGDRKLVAPGAFVFVIAQKAADGSLSAGRVLVGKDGTQPPM
jgi:hypothetical protein